MNPSDANPDSSSDVIHVRFDDDEVRFTKILNHVSRQKVDLCWHCWTCVSGCPFAKHMDLFPNQVLRLVQLGRGREALGCQSIWICVGCHTCSGQCPNGIDVAAVMDALRQLALREGIVPAEKEIYRFHKYIYESIRRHGRLNKLEAMLQFKLGTGQIFSDLQVGFRMLTRGKLELLPQRVRAQHELGRIFSHYNQRRGSFKTNE